MINLLPPDLKEDYRYARFNRRILRWAAAFVVAILIISVITGIGIFIMKNSVDTYQTRIANAQSELTSQNVAEAQKQVTDISSNLKLMETVLSREILFSKLLMQLGSITPLNVILTGLSISQAQTTVDITAVTNSYAAATQLQVNLADPGNQIFSKADIISIGCVSPDKATNQSYPCTANIRALFTTNNPFLFINSGAQKVIIK